MSLLRHARRSPAPLQHSQHPPPVLLISPIDARLTLDHPGLEVRYSDERRNAAGCDRRHRLVHCGVCSHVNIRPLQRAGDDAPSIFPCSQSTMIQSGFALASALDTLDPGNICCPPCQYNVGAVVCGQEWGLGPLLATQGLSEMILVMISQCKGKQYPDPIAWSFILDKGCPQPVRLLHRCGSCCHGGHLAEL